jgi:hypothetical protein
MSFGGMDADARAAGLLAEFKKVIRMPDIWDT